MEDSVSYRLLEEWVGVCNRPVSLTLYGDAVQKDLGKAVLRDKFRSGSGLERGREDGAVFIDGR